MPRIHRNHFAGCFAGRQKAEQCRLVFAGLCCDLQSSHRRGSARGPGHIRRAYDGACYNSTTESGVDLAAGIADLGDFRAGRDWKSTARRYQAVAETLFSKGKIPFFAGGDHAVTIPIGRALAAVGRPVHIVQFDAHPDLYPKYEGDSESHACVAARLLEMPHVATLTQIGIRTMNAPQAEVARRHTGRLKVIPASMLQAGPPHWRHIPRGAAVYVTLDLDVFDPAFAPGVSHPVPGGLLPRQVLNYLQRVPGTLVGMDVVELNPARDESERTAVLAGRLLHEGMGWASKELGG